MDRGAEKRRTSSLKIDLKSTNGLFMKTVNPCNDFLVDFLIASKLKSEKQGIGKFTTYNLAIESVRKYPLPIICEAQLAALEGFGDFFINEAAKRIQKHYKRGRLPTQQELQQDDEEHFQALQNNRRKGYRKKKQDSNKVSDEEDEEDPSSKSEGQCSEFEQSGNGKQNEEEAKEKKASKKNERYRPRRESEAWKLLVALFVLDEQRKGVAKGKINEVFFNWTKDTVKCWEYNRKKLQECGYIEIDDLDESSLKLAEKGLLFITEQLGEEAEKYKSKILQKKFEASNCFDIDEKGKVRLIKYEAHEPITILISQNLKTVKDLIPKYLANHHYESKHMELGSFVWKVYDKILNYLVIRYQFVDNESTKENLVIACNLARSCDWEHITIIVEGLDADFEFDEELSLKKQKMLKAIQNCKTTGFRVLIFQDFEKTLKYISEITNILSQKLSNLKAISGLKVAGSLQQLNKKASQNKKMAKLFLRCVRLLPGINAEAAKLLTLKFGTFGLTHKKMVRKFATMEERKKFLMRLLHSERVSEENIDKILAFFYAETYP